jgi:hypothetical protein
VLTISNCTIVSNRGQGFGGPGSGGGVLNEGVGMLTVNSSTITGNSAIAQGGGIVLNGSSRMFARNTIIAGNMARAGPDVYGNIGSQGYNLLGNPVDASGWVDTDLFHVDPMLGPLQDKGGPTLTIVLLRGSPALNAGEPTQLGVAYQRGVIRAGGVNIEAYQASASTFNLTAPDTVTTGVPFDLVVSAVDRYGQVAIGYTGTVAFSSSDTDSGVVLPNVSAAISGLSRPDPLPPFAGTAIRRCRSL